MSESRSLGSQYLKRTSFPYFQEAENVAFSSLIHEFIVQGIRVQISSFIFHQVLKEIYHYLSSDIYEVPACVCACYVASVLSDSATLRSVAHQAPLPMGFCRQESWSKLPCPPSGDLSDPGIEHMSLYISCISWQVVYH